MLQKTHTKVLLVLRYQGFTCIYPYYHEVILEMLNVEMWKCGNMTTERAVRVGVGGDKEVGAGGGQNLKT